MSKTKCTKTRAELEEEARGKIKAKNRVLHAKCVADAVKKAVPKPRWTHATGKKPHWQLATKAPQKEQPMKPCTYYTLIAMQEIHHFQKSVDLLIPPLPFQQLLHKMSQDFRMNLCFQSSAILALQEAAEAWLVQLFESVNLCTIHCGQQTIAPKDIYLVKAVHHIASINLWWK